MDMTGEGSREDLACGSGQESTIRFKAVEHGGDGAGVRAQAAEQSLRGKMD